MKFIVRKMPLITFFIAVIGILLFVVPQVKVHASSDTSATADEETVEAAEEESGSSDALTTLAKTLGAALAIGICAVATSYVQAKIGTAGIGSITENNKNFGMALIFLVIPETILIFGFVIAAIIIFLL